MPDHQWIVLNLEAPLMAFGGVAIDNVGVTRDFPAASMLTGVLANALGWHQTEWEKHQALQDGLVFAARRDREHSAGVLKDTQNAALKKGEKGWTTWGVVERRGGNSYKGPHRRMRDYHMDCRVIVALRVEAACGCTSLDVLGHALDYPKRPLFIGRKPCLPAAPLRQAGFVTASNAFEALRKTAGAKNLRALWPWKEGPSEGAAVHRVIDLADLRNWRTGLHSGSRKVVEGVLTPEQLVA
jgi:CRISPR system Cascade subunit CasD